MNRIKTMLTATLSSERTDARLVERSCSAAAVAVLVLGLIGVARLAGTPGEILIGSLVTCIAAVQLAVAAVVIPSAMRNRAAREGGETPLEVAPS